MGREQSVPKVAVVYHFFAHYRGAILDQLLNNSRCHILLVGDVNDPFGGGIEAWPVTAPDRFILTRCRLLFGRVLIQPGLIRLALRRDLETIIYLGNAAWPMTWLSAALARLTGKRVLFWSHGWTRRESGLVALIRRCFYRLAHGLLLYGHLAKVIGMADGFPAERLHVIYNSLDYPAQKAARNRVTQQRVRDVRRKLFSHPDRPLVICSSRLTRTRRLDLLLDALDILHRQGHDVNLLLVGSGPEQPALQRLAEERGLWVNFYGPCYDEQRLAELTMAANVTVAPGKVGLTAMQSLAFGTPVITHDDPDDQMPEWEAIIPGRTGTLFRREDVANLAAAIREWTGTEFTPPDIREKCHELIDRFYNPLFQRAAIERAIEGLPADDLFWMKGPASQDAAPERLRGQREEPV